MSSSRSASLVRRQLYSKACANEADSNTARDAFKTFIPMLLILPNSSPTTVIPLKWKYFAMKPLATNASWPCLYTLQSHPGHATPFQMMQESFRQSWDPYVLNVDVRAIRKPCAPNTSVFAATQQPLDIAMVNVEPSTLLKK